MCDREREKERERDREREREMERERERRRERECMCVCDAWPRLLRKAFTRQVILSVVKAWSCVGTGGGAMLSRPVKVIVGVLCVVAQTLVKITAEQRQSCCNTRMTP